MLIEIAAENFCAEFKTIIIAAFDGESILFFQNPELALTNGVIDHKLYRLRTVSGDKRSFKPFLHLIFEELCATSSVVSA